MISINKKEKAWFKKAVMDTSEFAFILVEFILNEFMLDAETSLYRNLKRS